MDDRNIESPQNASTESWSGTTCTSNGGRGTSNEALGDTIAACLTSLIEDSIQHQFISAKEQLRPLMLEIKGSSDEILERLNQSRKQALQRRDELEVERKEIHQAACDVINALNDTMEGLHKS